VIEGLFPLIGPSYNLRRRKASVQRTVNMIPVPMEPGNERSPWVLKDAPGLVLFANPAQFQFFTSDLYPVMTLENVDVAHAFTGGTLFEWPLENVDVSHAFLGGSLIDQLISYTFWPVESVDVAHAFTGGTITDVLLSYTIPVESVDVTHAFTGGTLAQILLTYSNYPAESVDVSHAFTGGTLT
jgi:hypothetical protein